MATSDLELSGLRAPAPGQGGAKTSPLLDKLAEDAQEWRRRGLERQRRTLTQAIGPYAMPVTAQGPAVVSFLSNDYLGLAAHPALRAAVSEGAMIWGAGSGASPLVSGHLSPHADAEQQLAAFVGLPSALLFITGYMANLGVLTSLLNDAADVIFSDQLNHASLIDGCRLSRARVVRYPHADLAALELLLQQNPGRRRLIATDAVFSMDGDQADLSQLLTLAETYDTLLLVDDAHGFGVCGPQGRGSLMATGRSSERVVLMGTLGKAAGLSGAFIAGSQLIIDYVLQRGRTYMFSTSPAPALAAAIPTALALIAQAEDRRAQLRKLARQLREGSRHWQCRPEIGETPIIPVRVGAPEATMGLMHALADQGVWVAGIRPPTVPQDTSRLRISLSASHQEADIERLLLAAARTALGGPAGGLL